MNRYDLGGQQARRNTANNVPITIEMLTGEGKDVDMIPQTYQQIHICAMKAWCSLPPAGARSEELSGVGWGPDEYTGTLFPVFYRQCLEQCLTLRQEE